MMHGHEEPGSRSVNSKIFPCAAPRYSHRERMHRAVSHSRARSVRARRQMSAQERPVEPGHRARPFRHLPVAQLGDQPRDRQGTRRRPRPGADNSAQVENGTISVSSEVVQSANIGRVYDSTSKRERRGPATNTDQPFHSAKKTRETSDGLSSTFRVRHQDDRRRANPKIFMSTRDTIVRAYMAGAILALAAGSP